jgi:hydroxymethylglutaryl-CoA synthase
MEKNTVCARYEASTADYFCFHAPYNKLVQKSFARLFLMDARRRHARERPGDEKKEVMEDGAAENPLEAWLEKPIEETYSDKALEKVLKGVSSKAYKERLADSNASSIVVGNTYTASVFLGLASLVDRAGSRGDLTAGKSIVLFSYGSGALATMYNLQV